MEAIKLTYPSDDNLQIPVYVHRPTRSLDSHPIGVPHISENGETDVVLAIGIHGGFFVIGSALHVPPAQIKYLTRHGFVVVAPDYRLCPQVNGWNGPVQDCLNLYAWIVSGALQQSLMEHHISLDESRIVLFGQSVGGTLCQILSFTVDPRPKAVLSFYPCTRFSAPWTGPEAQLRTMPDFPATHIAMAYAHRLSDPNPDIKRLPDGSVDWGMDPLSPRVGWYLQNAKDGTLWTKLLPGATRRLADPYEHRTTVPTFIVHGTHDHTIPSYVSREMVVRLRNWEVECDIIEAEGFGHGFDVIFEETDPEWDQYIKPGLAFLVQHVI